MINQIKNISTARKDLKNFGFVIGLILIIIYFIIGYSSKEYNQNLVIIGSIFITVGLIIPMLLKPVYLVWMTFALILGWVMTRIILSLLFYGIISPLGIFARILGKDFLNIKKSQKKFVLEFSR